MRKQEIELPPEPPLESKDVLVSKVIKLHESFRALLDDHAIPILRQTEYVHTGAYALEALVNALSGTTLQVCKVSLAFYILWCQPCSNVSISLSLSLIRNKELTLETRKK